MAAPSISVNQLFSTFAGFDFPNDLETNIANAATTNAFSNANQLSFSGSLSTGTDYYVILSLPTTIDATDRIFSLFVVIGGNNTNLSLGLRSGADNVRYWDAPTAFGGSFRLFDLHIDTSKSTGIADTGTGTFDITQVNGLAIKFTATGNATNAFLIRFFGLPYYYQNSSSVQVVGGDATNPLSLEAVNDLFVNTYTDNWDSANKVTYSAGLIGTSLIQRLEPIQFGDATTTAVAPGPAICIFTRSAANQDDVKKLDTNITESGWVTGVAGLSLPDYSLISNQLPFRFEDVSNGNTWERLLVDEATTVNLGDSDYPGATFQRCSDTTRGGRLVSATWLDCPAAVTYLWEPVEVSPGVFQQPDIAGSSFESPLATHYIDVPASVGTATLDVSEVSFTPLTSGGKIFRAAPGAGDTVTIQVAAGTGYTVAADVQNDGAGTVVIDEPAVQIRVFGFPGGATVSISQSGIRLDLLNNATAPYSYNTGSEGETGTIYTIKVEAAGKQDFITDLDITQSTSVTYLAADENSQQTLDKGLYDFQELMGSDVAFARVATTDQTLSSQLWGINSWRDEWNAAVVADGPSVAEIAAWSGYLVSTGYSGISFNPTTGEAG